MSSVSVSVGAKYVIMKGQTWNHSLIKVAVVHACDFSLFFLQIIVRVWYCYWKPHLKMASIKNFYYFISLYSSTLETWISSLNDFWDGEIFFPLWQPSGLPQSSSQFHCTLRLPFLLWQNVWLLPTPLVIFRSFAWNSRPMEWNKTSCYWSLPLGNWVVLLDTRCFAWSQRDNDN